MKEVIIIVAALFVAGYGGYAAGRRQGDREGRLYMAKICFEALDRMGGQAERTAE